MVNILIDVNSKKLVIFSHKEYLQVLPFPKWSLKHKLARLDQVAWHYIRHFYVRKIFNRIKNDGTIIGVHWGYLVQHEIDGCLADFHQADTTQGKYINGNVIQGFQSRDFITSVVPYQDGFDFITVSHNSKRKRLDEILDAFISLQKSGLNFKALLIVNTPSKKFQRNTRTTSIKFLSRYNSLPDDVKQNIVLLRLSPELGNFGISKAFILQMMRMSKYFILNSRGEGNAKVVTEALTSGCLIVGREDLQGNTFEVVPNDKLILCDNLFYALKNIIEHRQTDITSVSSNVDPNTYSVSQFIEYLKKEFQLHFKKNDPQLESLDKKLPSLYRDEYPWIKKMSLNNVYDLKKIQHWRLFQNFNKVI